MRKFFSLKHFLFSISALFFLALLFFSHTRGFVYYDEGYIINAASRVANGEIPYRDFDMVYTPFSFVFTGAFLKFFGESILITRIAAIVISLFSVFALYKIVQILSKNIFLQLTALLFFIAWGPAHSNFVWPVMFAICFLLYLILFSLYGFTKKKKKYFFLAGVMAVLVFLSKQNFGVAVFLVMFISLLLQIKKNKNAFIYFLYGSLSTGGIFALILLLTNSFVQFFQNMYVYTFQRILVQKSLDTPFLYHGSLLEKTAKFIFYTSPIFLAAIAFFMTKHAKKSIWIIPILCAVFYLIGIRPTTDYNHLAPLLALSCLPLLMIITAAKKKYLKNFFIALLGILMLVGFYTAYFKGYYKWDYPLAENHLFVKRDKIDIFVAEKNATEMNALISYIQSRTKPKDYIFVNYYAPLIYFIADRKNPTRYDFYTSHEMPVTFQKDAVKVLREKNVNLVIMNSFNKNESSIVADYIKKNYRVGKTIRDWIIYIK